MENLIACRFCNTNVKNNPRSLVGHYRRCKGVKNVRDNILTVKFLNEEYVNKQRSALDIANTLGFNSSTIVDRKLKMFNIPKRTQSEAKKTAFVKNKTEQTSMIRYGIKHNFCKNHPSRIEWETNLFLNEGIMNVFQRKEVIEKIANRIAEYKSDPRFGSRISKPHRIVNDIILSLGYKTKLEFKIENYYYDIHILDTNKIIEINGDLWHANPRIYENTDLVKWPNGEYRQVNDIWNKDLDKIRNAKNLNYYVLTIWEYDIIKNKEFNLKEHIINFLKI